jgi:hypothetical protein
VFGEAHSELAHKRRPAPGALGGFVVFGGWPFGAPSTLPANLLPGFVLFGGQLFCGLFAGITPEEPANLGPLESAVWAANPTSVGDT